MTREEAIKEIKSWDFLDGKEIEAIQTLIPELEENEDEKIIMTINNILPFIHDEAYTNNGTTKKDVLNWLEKQKEYVADNRKASTSYDDRIRKAIIKSIEEDSSVYEQEVSKEQMIAYLEKQKETGIRWFKSDEVKNPDKPYIDKAGMFYTTDGRMCYASEIEKQKEPLPIPDKFSGLKSLMLQYLQSAVNRKDDTEIESDTDLWGRKILDYVWKYDEHLEKQKEQKPSTPKYRVGDVMRTKQEAAEGVTDGLPVIVSVDENYYYCTNEKIPISEQEEYEFPPMNMKQKPAEWKPTEEQLNYLAKAIITLGEIGDCKTAGVLNEVRNGLKCSFPDWKVSPDYPKEGCNVSLNGEVKKIQEWSEEDEKIYQTVFKHFNSYKKYSCSNGVKKEHILSWLKSLKPSWKPSKEQMDVLFNAGNGNYLNGTHMQILRNLYNDLKKLM